MNNFWEKLDKPARPHDGLGAGGPFFCLAPMSDVTDIAFRHILAKYGKNRGNKNKVVFWTEFVAADGLCNKLARKKLAHILKYSERERPIVAQVFGANPENMKKACQYIASLDFDGIDINMGCPDKSVVAQGAGSALIKNPKLAREIVRAAREGIEVAGKKIPVSVKTRIGFSKEEINTWIPEILKEEPAALTVHLRTKKEMSDVPAHWELMPKILALRDKISPETLIIGNGDVQSLDDAKEKVEKYGPARSHEGSRAGGCDGVMIGRGVFGNPWFFNENEINSKFFQVLGSPREYARPDHSKILINSVFIEQKLNILIEHAQIFEKELLVPKHKHFAVMKKHFKAYVNGFEGAKELRIKLMGTENSKQVKKIIDDFLKKI